MLRAQTYKEKAFDVLFEVQTIHWPYIFNFSKVQIQIIFLSVFHPPRDDNKIGIYESLFMHIINFSHFLYF